MVAKNRNHFHPETVENFNFVIEAETELHVTGYRVISFSASQCKVFVGKTDCMKQCKNI